eukprot:gene4799-6540_t
MGDKPMRYDISGTVMQTVSIDLARGETVYAQTHAMAWMTDGIEMDTHTGGGLFAGLKRAMSGGSLFITEYSAQTEGNVAFAPRFPGQILAVPLASGQSLICRKETFLVAEKSVTLEIALQQRLGAGFFAGEGFILQRVTGRSAGGKFSAFVGADDYSLGLETARYLLKSLGGKGKIVIIEGVKGSLTN